MSTPVRPKYLYVRILEACNAGCFMCIYADSRDTFRFEPRDLDLLLDQAFREGVRYLKFTGGEPLMHRQIAELVRIGASHSMQVGLITNGKLLPARLDELVASGLGHVTVSIDSPIAARHNDLRRTKTSFENSILGIERALARSLNVRVNTVVGPHNFREMPDLQRVLTDLGIHAWELSALKSVPYPTYDNRHAVIEIGDQLLRSPGIKPLGGLWFGDTKEEQERYFGQGIPPRVRGARCWAAEDVMYLDAKNGTLFPCSCLPHMPNSVARRDGRIDLNTPQFRTAKRFFAARGPQECTNCSTSASGYSRIVDAMAGAELPEWAY